MKKIINDPFGVVDDTISGILKAYPFHLKPAPDSMRALIRNDSPVQGKVAILTGGGWATSPCSWVTWGKGFATGSP